MPTILDILTAPTVSPETLRIRAKYWRTVADRSERAGRAAQAERIRLNCACMEQQAAEMEAGPVASIVAPATKRSAKKAVQSLGAQRFWELHAAAVEAIGREYPGNWKVRAPIGETILATLPTRLRSFIGPLGTRLKYPSELRIPADRFWDVELPADILRSKDYPRATKPCAWKRTELCDTSDPGYAAWQAAWAESSGLVRREAIYLSAAENASADAKAEAERARLNPKSRKIAA